MEKKWDPRDRDDPNWYVNDVRASLRKPPIDFYNLGYVYTYDRTLSLLEEH